MCPSAQAGHAVGRVLAHRAGRLRDRRDGLLGVSGWQLLRGRHVEAFTGSARLAAGVALVCTVLVMVTGDLQARLMDTQQPMKMAAAEAVYRTQAGASFSLLTIGNLSGQPVFQTRIPHLLSLIATLSWNGTVDGITQVQNAEAARYGPGGYMPVLWVTYWSFRLMVGFGFLMLAASAWALWRSRRGSGRTLVVLTLLRFLDLTAGNLSIDGTDARACSPGEVRALLARSPEQPTLFPTSLRADLRVGAPHATDRQITDLLRQLRLGPWLDRLEQGLDTVLAPWAARSPAESCSASAWPGTCWPTAPCCFSTNPPGTSTRPPPTPCSRRCWSARPTGRCCGSPAARKSWPRSRRFVTSARTP
jgi:hypothetical protein